MRLVVQVQSPAAYHVIAEAFYKLPHEERRTLQVEMARTGIKDQSYSLDEHLAGGPAFLVHLPLTHLSQKLKHHIIVLSLLP